MIVFQKVWFALFPYNPRFEILLALSLTTFWSILCRCSLHKIPKFHLRSWYGNFVKRRSSHRVHPKLWRKKNFGNRKLDEITLFPFLSTIFSILHSIEINTNVCRKQFNTIGYLHFSFDAITIVCFWLLTDVIDTEFNKIYQKLLKVTW